MTDERIERVARALCKTDGFDPDETSVAYSVGEMLGGLSEGSGVNIRWVGARWRNYGNEARRLAAAWDQAEV